jgi:hypothetical protein
MDFPWHHLTTFLGVGYWLHYTRFAGSYKFTDPKGFRKPLGSGLSQAGEQGVTMAQSLEEQTATLREAIAAQEGARATLGDAVADATIAALKEHLCWSFEIRSRPAST